MSDTRLLDKVDTVHALQHLIRDAKKRVFLVSPYFKISDGDLFRTLLATVKRGVEMSLVVRAPDKSTSFVDEAVDQLEELVGEGLNLYMLENLHAKFYVSETTALVTSLNLLETSLGKSIEIGMSFSTATPEYTQLKQFFEREIRPHWEEIDPLDLRGEGRNSHSRTREHQVDTGHCIRCSGEIALNRKKPFCRTDLAKWEQYENPDYPEKYCHECGEKTATSKRRPLCDDCYASKPF
jgi:phosphatidylserine/phosphatidylglycerophosphate/cardiolipin synthase-like enzyme